jgi:hypothetical protein
MSTGRVASTQLTSGTIALTSQSPVYTVPVGYYGIYNISFTNTASTAVTIRLAISSSAVASGVGLSEYFEWTTTVAPYGVFERTGLVALGGALAGSTPYIYCTSSGTAVNVNIYGIETSTS